MVVQTSVLEFSRSNLDKILTNYNRFPSSSAAKKKGFFKFTN